MSDETVMTINKYKKQPIEADRIYISGNVSETDQAEIIENYIFKKAKAGNQVIVIDVRNQYRDRIQEKLNDYGVDTYVIDPYDNFKSSDSLDIMSVLRKEPELYEKYKKIAQSVLPSGEAFELVYSYYMEKTDPKDYNFSDFIDTIVNFGKLTFEELTDFDSLPRTSSLYLSKFYRTMGDTRTLPDRMDSASEHIHQYLVDQVKRDVLGSIPGDLSAAKEVFSGKRGKTISLEKKDSHNRVIFLNTTCAYTDIIVFLLTSLFIHIEPSTVMAADGNLNYNKKLVKIVKACTGFVVSNFNMSEPAELIIVSNMSKQDAEERYLFMNRKGGISIAVVLLSLINDAIWAFLSTSVVTSIVLLFFNNFIPSDVSMTFQQFCSAIAAVFLPIYLFILFVCIAVSLIRNGCANHD